MKERKSKNNLNGQFLIILGICIDTVKSLNELNMKKLINQIVITLMLLFFNFNYSQNWDSIKKSSIVYIYFDHGEFQKIKDADVNNRLGEFKRYEIKFDDNNYLDISDRAYYDYDSIEANEKMERKWVKKSFLKKNKNLIIDINFIKKYGLEKVYFLIDTKKKYLIDKKEIIRNKILLKNVTFGYSSYSYQM